MHIEGVSLPRFDAMIFATPRRAKIYQTLKRIFRMGGNLTVERKVIDIVDIRTKLKNQLKDRKEQYQRDIFGMTIKERKISFDKIKVDYYDLYTNVCKVHQRRCIN